MEVGDNMKLEQKNIKKIIAISVLLVFLLLVVSGGEKDFQKNGLSETSSKQASYKVYKTPTGKRYHLDADCGGKNSTLTTLEDAINIYGLTPCKKCAQ